MHVVIFFVFKYKYMHGDILIKCAMPEKTQMCLNSGQDWVDIYAVAINYFKGQCCIFLNNTFTTNCYI